MGFLQNFLTFSNVVIQCHDNPDADALASGFGLYTFFRRNRINVKFVYAGRKMSKSNLVMMKNALHIPVVHTVTLPECDLLITTDCQYGESNVTKFNAPHIGIIDHHQVKSENSKDKYTLIKSNLASCSTIVWDLLREEGIDVNDNVDLSTALYYGLYTDSNSFEEVFHPMDRDMRDSLKINDSLLFRLINSNLSIDELGVASRAITGQNYRDLHNFSVIESAPCDPNILGIISDFVIKVEEINTCVAFNRNPSGYKLSVRSCVTTTKANELAEYLCKGIGNGGGHLSKAGGFISAELYEQAYPNKMMIDYLMERMDRYHEIYDIISAETYNIDITGMEKYRKKALPVGFVKAHEILRPGTPILIRTLEGDIDQIVKDDVYLMVGILGEVYPIDKYKFEKSYSLTDKKPLIRADYTPTIKDNVYGEIHDLRGHIHACIPNGETTVYARQLTSPVKLFTAWDKDKYYKGEVGDYIVAREDDMHDIYVIRGDIFDETYEHIG